MTRIGITCSHPSTPGLEKQRTNLAHYVKALSDAGAESVFVWRPRAADETKMQARAEKLACQLGGLVVSGGRDLPPEMFGEEMLPNSNTKLIHPLRPAFEDKLIGALRAQRKPILGICYGCQLLNVLEGGTMFQDIALQVPGAMQHSETRHNVRLEPNTRLHKIIGEREFETASFHHQAIALPAPNAQVAATARDGIIEAIEFPGDDFFIGVQWHPERDRESGATKKLFAAFVSSAKRRS
jgi:putative glutamine amidotransferase